MTLHFNHESPKGNLPGSLSDTQAALAGRLGDAGLAPQAPDGVPLSYHFAGTTPETNYDGELDAWLGLDADALKGVGRIKAAVVRVLARRSPGRRVFWRPRLV